MNKRSSIILENVNLRISNKLFFDNFSTTFSNNGLSVILGPNGSGKTLLTKIINGIIKIDSGNILFNKNNSKIGYSPQKIIFLRRNVFENLSYPLKIKGYDNNQITKKINFLLKKFNIYEKKYVSARNLSGGLAQYVSFIRSIILKPDILILDEPCSNLDNDLKKNIERYIKTEKKKKKIILVTHDIFQAKRLADEIILLNDGKLIENSNKKSFINSKNQSVKRFLRDNLL